MALAAGDLEKARTYASELLGPGLQWSRGGNAGNALFHGNIVLGRIALREGQGNLGETARDRINGEIEELVGYMLFADEEPLKAPVKGVSAFTKTFAERGPRDPLGRSLRDFDLQKRLFRYPLSYLIYSAAFDGMPDLVRERIYRRIYEILNGQDQSKTFAGLSPAGREAALEIVRATKPNLPKYWLAARFTN